MPTRDPRKRRDNDDAWISYVIMIGIFLLASTVIFYGTR